MQYITKLKLATVHQICDGEDKSTEYMLQAMQDIVKVDLDTCIKYLELDSEEHSKLFKELNSLIEVFVAIDESKI
jgi:hypothetical protein